MKSHSSPKRTPIASAHALLRLPVEVIEMCLRFSAEVEDRYPRLPQLKQMGSLRLVSCRFLDVLTKDLFSSVVLCLVPIQGRPAAFLDLVEKNNKILKYIRHLQIQLSNVQQYLSLADVNQAYEVVETFSQAPLITLTICNLDKELWCSPIFNALHALRSIPSLQALEISGSSIPPFLVCGHFAATRLKSIRSFCSSPDEMTAQNLDLDGGLSVGPDSVLAMSFQPFANIEALDFPNAVDIPKYFPLQDFGSAYYPSNGRLPFTLPVLRELRVGYPDDVDEGFSLKRDDYKILGTLLARAPMLETLCITDEFWRHDGLDDFAPLLDQLPSLKNLTRLEFVDNNNERDGAINMISSILGAFPPVPSLKTLYIDFQWAAGTWNIEAARATLYFSEAWMKLLRALARPALASLQVLMLDMTIRITGGPRDDVEIFGPEEMDAFREALVNLYSPDGKLDVVVDIGVTY